MFGQNLRLKASNRVAYKKNVLYVCTNCRTSTRLLGASVRCKSNTQEGRAVGGFCKMQIEHPRREGGGGTVGAGAGVAGDSVFRILSGSWRTRSHNSELNFEIMK